MRTGCIAVVVGLAACAAARADLVTLREGIPLQGKVLEGTEGGVRLRLIEGGEVFVPWDRLIDRDVQRLKERLGFIVKEAEPVQVPGVRVTLTDGTVYRGVLLPPRGEGRILLKLATGPLEIPNERIALTEEIQIDALEAYTPRQLYQMHVAEAEPASAADHFELAQFCRRIGDYEKALEHLQASAELEPDASGDAVRVQIEEVERILAQRDARRIFDEVRAAARRSQYSDALEAFDRLEADYPGSPFFDELARQGLDRDSITEDQRAAWRARVVHHMYLQIREVARQAVREEEFTLAEAKGFAEKGLADAVVASVAGIDGFDEALVRELWSERGDRTKRRATYGPGTYLVEKPRKKEGAPTAPPTPRGDRSRQRSRQQTERTQAPPRPTPEDWWKRAEPITRREWLLAYFAEHCSDVRVLRIEYDPCVRCAGRGWIPLLNTEGGSARALCERCWGVARDRIVVYQ